jgi:hypothetical protein
MTIINIEDLLLKDIWFTCLEYLSFKDAVEFFAFFKPEWCSQMRLEKYTIPSLKRNFHTAITRVDDRHHRVKKMKWPYTPSNKTILSFVNLEELSLNGASFQQLENFVFPETVQTLSVGNSYLIDCKPDKLIQWPPRLTTLILHNRFPLVRESSSQNPYQYLPSSLQVLKLPGETFECIFKNTNQPYRFPHLFLIKGKHLSYDIMIARFKNFLETRPFLLVDYVQIRTRTYLYYRRANVDPVECPSV